MNKHEFFMRKCLQLAERGRGSTSPNPIVGAVLVKKGRIIAESFHKRAGALHAEPLAIKKAGKLAPGSTLYVNLEPCAHFGRTPPCVDIIIKSKIKKVFCAMKDPNPINNGRGIRILRKNNIKVSVGLLENKARELNNIFIKYVKEKLPFVTLKLAESLDGRIATKEFDSKWITDEPARNLVHKIRREVDAILVGVNTVIKDDPLLTSRSVKNPIKVILDPDFRVPEKSKIFSKVSSAQSIIIVSKEVLNNKANLKKISRLNRLGTLVLVGPKKNNRFDLKKVLHELAGFEISSILIEGGSETSARFLEQGLVDRVLFFIAPKIIGGKDALGSVGGSGAKKVKDAIKLNDIKIEKIGNDILVSGYVYRNSRRNR